MTDTFFTTSDVCVSSWLLTKRVAYRGCDQSAEDRNITVFCFKPDQRIPDLVADFGFDGECSAKAFAANYKFLMGEIRQAKRNGRSIEGGVK